MIGASVVTQHLIEEDRDRSGSGVRSGSPTRVKGCFFPVKVYYS
jgi:hypothetical protein